MHPLLLLCTNTLFIILFIVLLIALVVGVADSIVRGGPGDQERQDVEEAQDAGEEGQRARQ